MSVSGSFLVILKVSKDSQQNNFYKSAALMHLVLIFSANTTPGFRQPLDDFNFP